MGEFYPVYVSPVILNDNRVKGCQWEIEEFPIRELCRNDLKKILKIEFFEIKNVKEVDKAFFLADLDFSLQYLSGKTGKFMPCFNATLTIGKVRLLHYHQFEKTQFIDYIYGGLDISSMVAIDCTIGNGHPSNESSLHYLGGV